MVINKIVLAAGRIESQQALRPENWDPALLRQAQEALALLRSNMRFVTNPLPDGPEMTVALGWPSNERDEQRARERWQERIPDFDPAAYEVERVQQEENDRRNYFYLAHRGVTKSYRLLTLEASEYDGGLNGLIIGSSLRNMPPRELQSEEERISRRKQIAETVRECVALRPGFIAPSPILDDRSLFADHFAVAMLLSVPASDQ